jgi:betaine-aldehyde dehydrogenase
MTETINNFIDGRLVESGTADRMTRELDFGCVWVNAHHPFVSEMPHGGFGASGYGKDLSGYGFDDYTRIRHVMSAHY